jgi:hypothetical protein
MARSRFMTRIVLTATWTSLRPFQIVLTRVRHHLSVPGILRSVPRACWPLKSSSVVSYKHKTTALQPIRACVCCQCGSRIARQSTPPLSKKRYAAIVFAPAIAGLGTLGHQFGRKSLHQYPCSPVQARIPQIGLTEFLLRPSCRSGCQLRHAKGENKRDFASVYKCHGKSLKVNGLSVGAPWLADLCITRWLKPPRAE